MGTYDTRGGTPRHDPMFDYDPPCDICGKDPANCECPEWLTEDPELFDACAIQLGGCSLRTQCIIEGCEEDACVWYPLLPRSPGFCSEHHTPKYAEPYGCNFSGPDDFDIPVE